MNLKGFLHSYTVDRSPHSEIMERIQVGDRLSTNLACFWLFPISTGNENLSCSHMYESVHNNHEASLAYKSLQSFNNHMNITCNPTQTLRARLFSLRRGMGQGDHPNLCKTFSINNNMILATAHLVGSGLKTHHSWEACWGLRRIVEASGLKVPEEKFLLRP